MGCALLVGAFCGSASAQAAAGVSLRFEGERCVSESAALSARGNGLFGRAEEGLEEASLSAVVQVEAAEGPGVTLSLTLFHGEEWLGERRITGADCDEVLAAAALVVSLALAPHAEVPEQPSPVPPRADEPVVASPLLGALLGTPRRRSTPALRSMSPRAASTQAHVEARPNDEVPRSASDADSGDGDQAARTRFAPSFGVSIFLAVGELPAAAPGIEGRASLGLGPLRLEGAARYVFDQEVALGQHPTARVRVGLATGSVALCLPFSLGSLTLGPCAGLEAGAIWGESSGISDPRAATSLWVAPWATATAATALPGLPWLRFRADVGLTVPVVAPEFVVDGFGAVHRPRAVTFRLGIGAEVHFR